MRVFEERKTNLNQYCNKHEKVILKYPIQYVINFGLLIGDEDLGIEYIYKKNHDYQNGLLMESTF